jgi:hypothetical protein
MMPTISSRAIYTPARNAAAAAANTGAAAISVPPVSTPAPAPCCCPACTGLQCLDRTRFFAGQLLTEADLNNDQSYWLAKSRLHNRYLFGWGVVCGMQVVCSPCEGWVTVKTGYAIDPCGNDIIVCSEQPFNVIQAIQGCCTPAQPPDCSPLRSAPPPNCQDAIQKWCITIQYEEQPTRTVTPLKQTSTQSACGCGCGGGSSKSASNGGCGCGGGTKPATSGSAACCCSSAPMKASTTPGCEPTRILEGFRLGVCPAPPDPANNPAGGTKLGTRTFPGAACIQAGEKIILQQPPFNGVTDPNVAYTLACNYLMTIRKYLATASFTSCKEVDDLNNTAIPKPSQTQGYVGQVESIVASMVQSLQTLLLDCVCFALLPTCPPDPCTNCLILACVTIQNGEIIDICHFGGGRRQVVTFPALGYWLSLFGVDKLLTTLTNFLEQFCCEGRDFSRLFQSAFLPQENLAATGLASPAMFQQLLSATLAQNLGANILNASSGAANTFDLRPLVGLSIDEVSQTLKRNELQTNVVEASPAWTDSVIAQGADFAPSAFPAGQPLTVYTRNKLVVGFQPTSATDSLRLQVAELTRQVQALQGASDAAPKKPRKE